MKRKQGFLNDGIDYRIYEIEKYKYLKYKLKIINGDID